MPRSPAFISLGASPLTDPRALASSATFHVILFLLVSLTALNVALPVAVVSHPKALYGEIDPVDNRADIPTVRGEGGGGVGEIGGMGSLPFVPSADGTKSPRVRDPVADTLLAEILPSSEPSPSESGQRALPGPQAPGQGLIPGSGRGGGGGSGGGSGSGLGRGIGPGTEFFGASRPCSLFCLRDRLLWEHGDTKLAGSRQTRNAC